jgi:hypothetical protein
MAFRGPVANSQESLGWEKSKYFFPLLCFHMRILLHIYRNQGEDAKRVDKGNSWSEFLP